MGVTIEDTADGTTEGQNDASDDAETMMNELYNQRILKLAAGFRISAGSMTPHAAADAQSRLCGSKVHVELSLAD